LLTGYEPQSLRLLKLNLNFKNIVLIQECSLPINQYPISLKFLRNLLQLNFVITYTEIIRFKSFSLDSEHMIAQKPAPLLWNQLSVYVWEADILSNFKIRLQTFLFDKAHS